MKRVIRFYEKRQNEKNQKLHPHVNLHGHSNSIEHSISSTLGTLQRSSDFAQNQTLQQIETNNWNRKNNEKRKFATRMDLMCFLFALVVLLFAFFIQYRFR